MTRKKANLFFGAMLSLFAVTSILIDVRADNSGQTVEAEQTDNALKILSRSTRFVESAQTFRARGNFGADLILENGQIVESGLAFTVIFNRPDNLYLELDSWDGDEVTLFIDGETITVASDYDGRQVYDFTPQTGDVNESLDFVAGVTGGPRELDNFLSEDFTDSLDNMQSGLALGESTIAGILCDHLAVRSDVKDAQVWVERGDEPKPWRILITHREEPAQPRFWVQFDEWDFSPEINESTFRYTPGEDAIKVRYLDK